MKLQWPIQGLKWRGANRVWPKICEWPGFLIKFIMSLRTTFSGFNSNFDLKISNWASSKPLLISDLLKAEHFSLFPLKIETHCQKLRGAISHSQKSRGAIAPLAPLYIGYCNRRLLTYMSGASFTIVKSHLHICSHICNQFWCV